MTPPAAPPPVHAPAPLVAGTAGHVDHGKTALVRALTGIDTDRLEQERVRGLSIELGFAPLTLPSGRSLSIVDVPGHERFVRTMVAGATGIDCFVMVIAATEGVRAQTIEHARILEALDVRRGLVVITKTDMAAPAPAIAAAQELLPGTPVLACPPAAADRRAPVLAALDALAAGLTGRAGTPGPAVLHIDRSFTVSGAGTVVTGTLRSGAIAPGDTLILAPRGRPVRVRGVQIHGRAAERAIAGERVAVNLARVARDAVARGDVLAAPGAVDVAHVVRVAGETGQLRDGDVVHIHHGTRATPARVRRRSDDGVSLRCRRPLIVAAGDRLVIRDGARRRTLGGATVLGGGPEPVTAQARRPRRARPAQPAPGSPSTGDESSARPQLDQAAVELAGRLRAAGTVPTPDRGLTEHERNLLAVLAEHGLAVRLAGGHHAAPEAVATVEREIRDAVGEHGSVTLPQLRDRLGGSRSQAKAFLDYFDGSGLTVRRPDDRRVLRGGTRAR